MMRRAEERSVEMRTLRGDLVDFFHREIDRRYNHDYLSGIPAVRDENLIGQLDEQKLERIKEFFKRVLYPTGQHRDLRDTGMETVKSVLGNVGSIVSLLPHLPGLLLRHGPRLPLVTAAATDLVAAYDTANRLEVQTLRELERSCNTAGLDETRGIPEHYFRRAYAALSEEDVDRMVELLHRVVRLGLDRPLVRTTREVVEAVAKTRTATEEVEALEYVKSVLDEVHEFAAEFSRGESQRIIRLARETEAFYFAELRRETTDRSQGARDRRAPEDPDR